MTKKKRNKIIWIVCLTAVSIIMLIPFLMMVSTSLKTDGEIHSAIFHFIPKEFKFDNYITAMKTGNWLVYFRNSITITLISVTCALLFNSIAGFAFARLRFPGANILFTFLLIGLMMPPQVTLLPTFLIMAKFPLMGGNDIFGNGGHGLVNSLAGIIIPLVSGSYGVFLCKQFYENFPRALDEAATIDGVNKWQLYFWIYLPNSKVILATLAVMKGVSVWNDYMWPLVMTNSEASRTVQLALSMFKDETVINWGPLMAASIIVSLPMIILYFCAQKYFVQGLLSSGLKG